MADRAGPRRGTGPARLTSLGLAPPHGGTAAAVVRHLGAIQAQDYASALWAVGVRSPGLVATDVEAALASGDIVRTWPMRGTLHLVPGADARWMCRLLNGPVERAAARRHAQLGLTEDIVATARAVVMSAAESAAAAGHGLLRSEAFAVLDAAGISPADQRGYHILSLLAREGRLGQGARVGTDQAFWPLDALAVQRHLDRDEAMATIARRYVRGRAPVTEADLAWWTGQGLRWAREALALAGIELDPAPASPAARTSVLLLPGFDEYLLGYADRGHAGGADLIERVVPGGNGMFLPMLVTGRGVVGTWRRAARRDAVAVTPTWFVEPSPTQRAALHRAVTAYARFVGLTTGTVRT